MISMSQQAELIVNATLELGKKYSHILVRTGCRGGTPGWGRSPHTPFDPNVLSFVATAITARFLISHQLGAAARQRHWSSGTVSLPIALPGRNNEDCSKLYDGSGVTIGGSPWRTLQQLRGLLHPHDRINST